MSPEKIAYQKLQALSCGHNISAKGGIDRNYFSLKKSTARLLFLFQYLLNLVRTSFLKKGNF
jgi:hypothetical protein